MVVTSWGSVKIVSGGQTGVDRAALDAALESGVEAGGWCPEGRMAEDGPIPDRYPLQVLPGAGYPERTRQNVQDSDGTLIIYFGQPSGGTEKTLLFCIQSGKPYVLIDGDELTARRASQKVRAFVERRGISVLNVAGPRASGEAKAYSYARQVVQGLLGRSPGTNVPA